MLNTYTLPREAFNLLVEAFGEQKKAEIFARAMEAAIVSIQDRAHTEIIEKKDIAKIELKDDLRSELVTRELFEESNKNLRQEILALRSEINEQFKVVGEKFKALNFKLNIFLAIALAALTLANPTFVALIEKIF